MVSWAQLGDSFYGIAGTVLSAAGALEGGVADISSSAAYNKGQPDAVYDYAKGLFLVVFLDDLNGFYRVYGQYMADGGGNGMNPDGLSFAVSEDATGADCLHPQVAYDASSEKHVGGLGGTEETPM